MQTRRRGGARREGRPEADADLIVRGRILLEAGAHAVRAIAVGGGRVLDAGTEGRADRWRGRRTKVWDLRPGQTALPGFVDAHAHLAEDAWRRTWVDLAPARSLEDAVRILKEADEGARGRAWLLARGWDETTWPAGRYLTRQDLDAVRASRPILANRVDGHLCSVNSLALRAAGVRPGEAGVQVGRDGEATGVLTEEASDRARAAVRRPSGAEAASLLEAAIAHVHALGVTGVHDIVGLDQLRTYRRLRRQGRLRLRVYAMPYDRGLREAVALGLRTGSGDAWLRVGAMKAFADGSLGARTAALREPYGDDPGSLGQALRSPADLLAHLAEAHEAGFQLAVHAIGDRAIDDVVGAMDRVLDARPRPDHRHRIEHAELPSDEAIDRMAELGIVASVQPNFVARWSQPGGLYERRLGARRLARNNPYRTLLARGVPLAFGSDGMPYGPLLGIRGAVEAPFEDQRIPVREALRAYTAGAAHAGFAEAETGALRPGLAADFVVLSRDPGRGLRGIRVDATVVGGEAVYRRVVA